MSTLCSNGFELYWSSKMIQADSHPIKVSRLAGHRAQRVKGEIAKLKLGEFTVMRASVLLLSLALGVPACMGYKGAERHLLTGSRCLPG